MSEETPPGSEGSASRDAPASESGFPGSASTNSSTHLVGVDVGGFVIEAPLGEGGMGAVFRCRHAATGVPAALKVIRGIADDESRSRFQDEVEAHAALVHPGIVYLFEYGRAPTGNGNDEQFVAMELGDGTLRERIPHLDWPAVRSIVLQILDALAFAHARNVVHRDLKPENLLCFEEDHGLVVKLADFGIAHLAESVVDIATGLLESPVGTPLYMPPEQLGGRWRASGPWTDLYALGAIVYELVCGRTPFKGPGLLQLMMQHATQPRPPLRPRFEVPEGLEAWIHQAMAIDHRQRFSRAADALVAFPGLGESAGGAPTRSKRSGAAESTVANLVTLTHVPMTHTPRIEMELAATVDSEELPTITPEAPPTVLLQAAVPSSPTAREPDEGLRPVPAIECPGTWRTRRSPIVSAPLIGAGLGLFGLRQATFVGRDRERDVLWAMMRSALTARRPRAAVVAGEPGVGKSRIATWLARRAHEVGAVTVLSAFHSAGGSSSEGIAGMLRRHFRAWKLSREPLFEHLEQVVPRLSGESPADFEADLKALTEMARGGLDEDDAAMFHFTNLEQKYEVLTRLLRRLAQERPLLLWIDDAHWGAEATGLLEHLVGLHEEDQLPVFVLATVRSDVLADDASIRERFSLVANHPSAGWMELDALAANDCRSMLKQMLPLSPQLLERLIDRTEGNPLFTVHLLSHWVSEEVVVLRERGFDVAEGHELVVPTDIHSLWMSRVAAALADSSDREPEDHWYALELAATLGRLVDSAEWHAALRMAGLNVSNRLFQRLGTRGLISRNDEGWQFAHVLLCDSLNRRSVEKGRWDELNHVCARALTELRGTEEETAGRRARHWLESGERERALEPLLQEAWYEYKVGNGPKREEILQVRRRLLDALEIAPEDPRRLESDLEEALLFFYLGRTDSSERLALRAAQIVGDRPSEFSAYAAQVVGMCMRRRGRVQDARRWLNLSLTAAEALGSNWWIGAANSELCWLEMHLGTREDALHFARTSARAMDAAGDDHLRTWALVYEAWLTLYSGETEKASRDFDSLLGQGRQKGYRVLEGHVQQGIGVIHRLRGEWEPARYAFEETRRLAGWQPSVQGFVEMELCSVALHQRRFEEAESRLNAACETFLAMGALKYKPWTDMLQLALSAGISDTETFDRILEEYTPRWPEDAVLTIEHPIHLELAAALSREQGDERRVKSTLQIAERTWREYGRPDEANRISSTQR